jgi:hypothetical protein
MWLVQAGVGLLSVALALFTPPSAIGLPGWAYMLLAFLMPMLGVRSERRRLALFGPPAGSAGG